VDASQKVVLAEGQGVVVRRGSKGPDAKLQTKRERTEDGMAAG